MINFIFRLFGGFAVTVAVLLGTSHAATTELVTTRISSEFSGYPVRVSAAALADGGFVVAYSINSDATRIYFRRLDADMGTVGNETLFATAGSTGAEGTEVDAAALSGGGFAIAVAGQGVFLFQSDNSLFNTIPMSCFSAPSIRSKSAGSFIVAWSCGGSASFQQFDDAGNSISPPVEIVSNQQYPAAPRIAVLVNGSIVAVWDELILDDTGAHRNVRVRRFNADLTPVADSLVVNSEEPASLARVAQLTDGGYVIVRDRERQLLTQRFDSSGFPVGFENVASSTTFTDWLPAVSGTPDGGYVVLWQYSFTDQSNAFRRDQYFVRFDAANTMLGSEQMLNAFGSMCEGCPGYAAYPSVAMASSGKALVAWASHNGTDGWAVYAVQSTLDGNSVTFAPAALAAPVSVGAMSGSGTTGNAAGMATSFASLAPPVQLTTKRGTGFSSSLWASGCETISGETCITGLDAGAAARASFVGDNYALTVRKTGSGKIVSNIGGIDCGANCSSNFNYQSAVQLTANPSPGYTLSGWTNCPTYFGNICYVTMSAARTVSAKFTDAIKYPVNVVSGGGLGSISSSPAGISCGGNCSSFFNKGTTVTLSAVPTYGYKFVGWSGACSGVGRCKTVANSSLVVKALFEKSPTSIVSLAVSGAGIVTSSPKGISCGTSCSYKFVIGDSVVLTAKPSKNKRFVGWSGACSGTTRTCSVTVDSPKSITAIFSQ
jgi:hypothetical protein